MSELGAEESRRCAENPLSCCEELRPIYVRLLLRDLHGHAQIVEPRRVDVAELMPRHPTESRPFSGGLQHLAQQFCLASQLTVSIPEYEIGWRDPYCVRCGGNWKRDYGGFCTGTQGKSRTRPRSCLRITASVPDSTTAEFLMHPGELLDFWRAHVLPRRVAAVGRFFAAHLAPSKPTRW